MVNKIPNDRNTLDQTDRLQTLNEIGRAVSGTLDLSVLYETIYQQIGRVMDTAQFFIALHRPESNSIELVYHREEGDLYLGQTFEYGTSVTSLVIERGTRLLFGDNQEFQAYAETNGLPEIIVGEHQSQAKIWVPLNTGNRTIGALTVQSTRPHAYTRDDMQTLSVIASQAAVAIENGRLYSEQQNRVYELQTIQSIVQKLTPLHHATEIAQVINDELKQLIDYHACRIFALDQEEQVLVSIALSGSTSPVMRLRIGEGVAGWIVASRQPVIIGNTLEDERVVQIAGTPVREESMIGAPLVYQGRAQGVVTLTKLGINQFDDNALRLLEIIAAQAAISLDRARLYQELREEAITDPLTGLYNRRYLMDRFREERSRAIRNKHSLTAIMVDIDAFKSVNDRFTHDAGDVVLQELANLIRDAVRAEDLVARYGGEEFCVLLPEIAPDDAQHVAERLRVSIASHRMPVPAGATNVTVSVGMAMLSSADKSQEMFKRADLAMYRAKRDGGNRGYLADDDGKTFVRVAAEQAPALIS